MTKYPVIKLDKDGREIVDTGNGVLMHKDVIEKIEREWEKEFGNSPIEKKVDWDKVIGELLHQSTNHQIKASQGGCYVDATAERAAANVLVGIACALSVGLKE